LVLQLDGPKVTARVRHGASTERDLKYRGFHFRIEKGAERVKINYKTLPNSIIRKLISSRSPHSFSHGLSEKKKRQKTKDFDRKKKPS
jgi:hypothetical protein